MSFVSSLHHLFMQLANHNELGEGGAKIRVSSWSLILGFTHEDLRRRYSNDNDLIIVVEIWGTKDICSCVDVYKDKEITLYTKVLDVLALYQRTLPIAFFKCSFDAFKLLQEEPLLLSTFQQKSILSLLLESTRGLRFSAPGCEGPGSGIGQLYKYLQPLLKLMFIHQINTYENMPIFYHTKQC